MKPRKAAVIFIFITVTLDMLALGLIAPVLPKLVLNFLGGDAPNAAKMFGIFGTVFALMQFLFSPMLGVLSDRFGRRPRDLVVQSRTRPRLHRDGAGADNRLALCRPRHFR